MAQKMQDSINPRLLMEKVIRHYEPDKEIEDLVKLREKLYLNVVHSEAKKGRHCTYIRDNYVYTSKRIPKEEETK